MTKEREATGSGSTGPLAGSQSATGKSCHSPLLLFDGECSLCSAWVDLVLKFEASNTLRFATLQSKEAEALFSGRLAEGVGDTLVLIEDDRTWTRSSAVLRVVRLLRLPFPLLYGLVAIPRPIRDWIYNRIARNRYRLFGRRPTCRVPSEAERARFLGSGTMKEAPVAEPGPPGG